ncbi:MAG: signal peptidase II [Deltaproteobacteria bacterium]|nr:signal peptidase II [Deltaproteobacteria bacterium]
MSRRWKLFLLVAFFSILADQATKIWARETLPTNPPNCVLPDAVVDHKCYGEAVPVVDGYWDWRLSFNPGSAFGLFHSQGGARVFLSIVGLLAVAGMGWMVHKAKDQQRALLWALGLVAGGAIGNLIDRIYYGVVTDFVLWHWKTSAEWPVFNVADVVLVVGVGILLFDVGKEPGDKKSKKKPAKVDASVADTTVEKTVAPAADDDAAQA